MTEQRTTAEQRAALRRQMDWTGRGLHLWRHEATALLDDADALAGVLAECERLRTALGWYADPNRYLYRKAGDGPWLIKSEAHQDGGEIARTALAPQSPDALDELLDAGEAATPGFRSAVDDAVERRKRQRANAASEPAKITPGCPQDATQPETARNGAEGPVAGTTGEIREDAANGRTR